MKSIDEELPEDQDHSAIINDDTEFENSAVDPGFVSGDKKEDGDDADEQGKNEKSTDEQDEQDTERGAPGLGELESWMVPIPVLTIILWIVNLKKMDMVKKPITPSTPVSPRDGLDNTGTQGYDSLTDDAFTGSSKKPKKNPGDDQSHTGSSSEDFEDKED